jgi:uncharacterized LabA/DUF88 family protein
VRTIVYVDGFNLYFGELKNTAFKWLDLESLFTRVLSAKNEIVKIKYFTARVQATPNNPNVHIRQQAYLQALGQCCPLVEVHYGHFLRHRVRMENGTPPPATWPVWKTEEKGSDVNLALHVLNDAWQDAFDAAVIVSNDSDLAEAMRLVKVNHPAKSLGLITPGAARSGKDKRTTSAQLKRHADFQREIRGAALSQCQLPAQIPGSNNSKPAVW